MSSAHSISSDDATSSINSISADDSAAAVPSTSAARPVHLISPRLSTSSMIPLIAAAPTSSMLPMFSDHSSSPMLPMFPDHSSSPMLPMIPEPWMSPMQPIIPEPWVSPMQPIILEPWMSPMPQLRITRRNRNISCPYGLKYQKSFDFNDHRFLRHSRTPSAYEFSRLGLRGVNKPEKLEYASYKSRLNTFATWPTNLRQTSEELADAGFYYMGIMDFTVCYHCGIGIGNWGPEEHPWEQHAISSPSCNYLLTVRGFKYPNNVTGQELYESFTEVSTVTYTLNHIYS